MPSWESGGDVAIAQLEGTLHYDRRLRRDLEELSKNIWLGRPIGGQKAGNLRAVYITFSLTGVPAGSTFAVRHPLGEVPLGYIVVGTQTASVVPLSPGTRSDGSVIPWSAERIYLKAGDTDKTVCLLIWGTDSTGG